MEASYCLTGRRCSVPRWQRKCLIPDRGFITSPHERVASHLPPLGDLFRKRRR